ILVVVGAICAVDLEGATATRPSTVGIGTVHGAVPVVVDAVVADLLSVTHGNEHTRPACEICAVGEPVAVVVSPIGAQLVAELTDAAQLHDPLTLAVAAVERAVVVVVNLVRAELEGIFRAPVWGGRNDLVAEARRQTVWVHASDQPIPVIVAAVAAREFVGLIAERWSATRALEAAHACGDHETDSEQDGARHP